CGTGVQRGARRIFVDGDAQATGVGKRPVLVDEVDGDGVAVGTVGVGVGLVAGGGVSVGVAVAPVDDVTAHRVLARIGDRPQSQRVGCALIHIGRAREGDGRGDVVDR